MVSNQLLQMSFMMISHISAARQSPQPPMKEALREDVDCWLALPHHYTGVVATVISVGLFDVTPVSMSLHPMFADGFTEKQAHRLSMKNI